MDVGTMLGGRYAMRSRIAGGGMGEVWIAHDDVLDRTVAVKVIRRELAEDPEFARRFHQEARTAARLSHANIAQVHDFGRDADTDYLVMEYVRGTSLASMIDQHPRGLPPAQVVSLVSQAADGLEAAHEAGVVHRDVKPANILITDKGQVKITDFGIARALGEAKMTRTGEVMGTAQYLPPEAALGHHVDGQADLYSLAVVAYEALTGRRPFQADSAVTLAMKHVNEPPPPLSTNTPAAIRNAVMHGLAKNPAQRPAGVAAFARELRQPGTGGAATHQQAFTAPYAAPVRGQVGGHGGRHTSGPISGPPGYRTQSGPLAGGPISPPYAQSVYQPPKKNAGPASPLAKGLGWAWIALSLLVILSLYLTWATLNGQSWSAFGLELAEASYSSDPTSGGIAEMLLVVTLIIGALGIPQALGKGHLACSIVALVLSLIAGLLWAACLGTITGGDTDSSQLHIAAGAVLCGIVGFLHLPVIGTTIAKRR